MPYNQFSSTAVRLVEKIPVIFWAAWILMILGGTAVLAFTSAPVS
jgi:hypothetical protein